MDCWILPWMARQLGRPAEAAQLEAEHRSMASTINRLLWNPVRRCYLNRRWSPRDVAGALYDVSVSSTGLVVARDSRVLFTADTPVEIRQVEFKGDRVRFELRAARAVKLRVGRGEPQDFGVGVTRGAGRFQPRIALSIETVRTHLKRIFSKTGTNRQSELVRIAIASPASLLEPAA